jgi:zinc protease
MTRFLLALCALVVAASAHAQLKEVRQVEGVVEYALPNGLTVLVHADASKPTTTVNLVYRVGSKHEGHGETGAAHLLEHMLFKASGTIEDPKQEMTRRGARWNGTTSVDRTNYFAQFATDAETLDWMLGWLAESMTKARLDKRDLDTEMTVVRNELERAENSPDRILGRRMRSAAFQWHGYGRDVLDGERQVTLRRAGGPPKVAVLYHAMPAAHRDYAAARVLTQLLAQDRGPLEKALVDTRLGAGPWAWVSAGADPGFLMAGAAVADSHNLETAARAALDALVKTVEALQPTAEDFAKARAEVLQAMQSQLRDPEALSLALTESVAHGDWRLLFAHRDWVEAVTLQDVQRVAGSWLLSSNRTSGVYLPESTTPARAPALPIVDAGEVLRDYRGRTFQAVVEDFPLTPDNIEARLVKARLTVSGEPGLHLAVLPRQTKEARVTGILRLRWGTAESVKGSAVLATLLGPMFMQGSERMRAQLLALEAQLRVTTGAGGLTANFEVPARHLPAFLQLLGDVLRKQDLPDDVFERVRAASLAANRASQSDTAALAANTLQRALSQYPPGDPREARTPQETESLLRSATAAQLRAFWQRFAGAGHGELAMIGPVDPQQVRAAVQQVFGDWRSAEPSRPWMFEYPFVIKARWEQVAVPDKANASYSARIPLSMNEESPDYPALFAAVQLLGGRAGTALWKRVREQEGLSYGVGSSLFVPSSPRAEGNAGAINITASFAPENRDRLRAAIRDELQQRAKNGFSSLEVGFARRAIVSGRADWLAQPANLASLLANNLRWGRDMAWYAKQTQAYENLDTRAVNAALAKYLDLDRLTEVAAGTFR